MPDKEYIQELYEERAAIMQYDGNLSKEEAEKRAWQDIQSQIRQKD